MSKMSLTEATMMALQGKLEESKPVRNRKSRAKKQENIDINVDEKTSVSVMDNETIVDTEDATIIVDKKEDEFVPETSDGVIDAELPVEAPVDDVIEVPVEGDETIIPEDEVPVEQADEDEAVLDAEVDVDLPVENTETEDEEDKEESKKIENKIVESKNEHLSYDEFRRKMQKADEEGKELYGVIVITEDSFDKPYTEEERSYQVSNVTSKGLQSGKISNSIWGDCLDGKDLAVRLDNYIGDGWKVDYCYFIDDVKTESKKLNEELDIEISNDGKEVEVTVDDGEKVEVKDETPEEETEVDDLAPVEESKKEEAIVDVNAYKETALFRALCEEIEDIVCEDDDPKPTQEQIEQAVDVVINGYDYIWEDLHTALRTEIDKVTGKGDGDEYLPRYEAKSHRKSLGKVTESKIIKYSSKSFKEALNKFYTSNSKTIESVELTKFDMTKHTIILEAKLTNKDGMTTNKKLEMKQIAKNKNFIKYAMTEVSKIKTESKSAITMLVSTNKNNILECKYINKK